MSIYGQRAQDNFYQGCNCSQSVFAAFADVVGMTETQARIYSSGFGAGVGRLREVCGAFCGLTMVISILYGSADPEKKSEMYAIIQSLAAEFKRRNGQDTYICRELLGLTEAEGSPVAGERTEAYYANRPCPALVALAADICAEYIEANPEKNPVPVSV